MVNFKISEFDSPDEQGSGLKMDVVFLEMLDEARFIADTPFVINSGFRTKLHNSKVNGSVTSSHLKGLAADISCLTGGERINIVKGLIQAGFNRIGIADTFIHVDNDNEKPNSIWLY